MKLGVVLMNYGGPERLEDSEAYLRNIFNDPYILDTIPGFLRPLAARFIARRRAPYTRANFAAIGGGSPLNRHTEDQRAALAATLEARGLEAVVTVAQRYWHPRAEAAARSLAEARVERLVLLPLYPQFAAPTTRSSIEDFLSAWKRYGTAGRIPVGIVERFATHPGFIAAVAADIRVALAAIPPPRHASTALVFSAHGLPRRNVERGERYPYEVRASVEAVLAELSFSGPVQLFPDVTLAPDAAAGFVAGLEIGAGRDPLAELAAPHAEPEPLEVAQVRMAFQSRVGPLEWIAPYVDTVIEDLASGGITDAVVYPITFVSDHSETLYEIEILYGDKARKRGLGWHRVPALNDAPRFIEALADLVETALGVPDAGPV